MRAKRSKQLNTFSDGRILLEDFQSLSQKILHYGYGDESRQRFLADVFKTLTYFFGCDSVELHLMYDNKIFIYEGARFPEKFSTYETLPYSKADCEEDSRNPLGNSSINKLCWAIICGHIKSSVEEITQVGSYWTGNADNPLPFRFKCNPDKNETIGGEYKSLMIVPIRVLEETIGLLQLKSKRYDHFNKDEVFFLEGIAQLLGVTFMNRLSKFALRERIKELSCLYNIYQSASYTNVSLDEFLASVVQLLPPAWQYPAIAAARITLDEKEYITTDFHKWKYVQSSNIIVNGEKHGTIEVVYTAESQKMDEGPFLKEERHLIDAVARQVAFILERRRIELDRQKLQDQLRHADRLATIGQLAAGVAHELNEPLGSILGFAQLALKHDELPQSIKKDIDKIVNASLHAREVIKKLMIFARQVQSKKKDINLNQLVEEGLYFFEARCAKNGIELIRELEAGLPKIYADQTQLSQVLINIVVNAIQAMPDGGKLVVATKKISGFVSIIVRDTGIGMTENIKKQIFVPFFTTKDVDEGTGLGLSVVHGIIASHKGEIKVESAPGKGSVFEIILPIIKDNESEAD